MDTKKRIERDESESVDGRRSLVAGLGIAVAGLAAGSVTAQAQTRDRQTSSFQPTRHRLDAWLDEAKGGHRIFIDSASPAGGVDALLYGTNLFNAHNSAYDGRDSDMDIVICFRHFSTPFGYGDAIWKKYGASFQQIIQFPAAGQDAMFNPVNTADSPALPFPGITADSLSARGAQFAICANATRFFAGQLAAATDASEDEIFDELVAGAVRGGRFVAAGVIAATRSQEYGYSLLYAG